MAVTYQLRAGYSNITGTIGYGANGLSFNVGAALTAGGGSITTTDADLANALDKYPPLYRSADDGQPLVSPLTPRYRTLSVGSGLTTSEVAFEVRRHAEANARFQVKADGTVETGDGVSAPTEFIGGSSNATPSALVGIGRDGVFQVASDTFGSSDPTFFPTNDRIIRTAGGRVIAVHGKHADGQQLVWRDDGAWSTVTRGDVSDGRVVSGLGSGDVTSAVVQYDGAAWVFMAGDSSTDSSALYVRRITDLDNAAGPYVGALQTLRAGATNSGNSKVSAAVEVTSAGVARIAVLWLKQTATTTWDFAVAWITSLNTDAPSLSSETAIISGSTSGSRQGSLIQRDAGLGIVMRTSTTGTATVRLVTRGRDDTLTTWTQTSAVGVASVSNSAPHGVYFNGEWLTAVASDVTTGVVTVQRWNNAGTTVTTDITTVAGYWEPKLALVGEAVYVIMRKGSATPGSTDEIVTRRLFPGGTWTTTDRTELSGSVGTHTWPSPLVDARTFNRLLFLVAGVGASADQRRVFAVQRANS